MWNSRKGSIIGPESTIVACGRLGDGYKLQKSIGNLEEGTKMFCIFFVTVIKRLYTIANTPQTVHLKQVDFICASQTSMNQGEHL